MPAILTVDDSRAVRTIVGKQVKELGFEVLEAEDGLQGLQRLAESQVDLVLLDVTMPVLDGPGMLQKMREGGNQTPVIMLTSEAKRSIVAGAMKLGIADYILKPFKPEELRQKVLAVLQGEPDAVEAVVRADSGGPSARAEPSQGAAAGGAGPAGGGRFVDVLVVDDMENVAKKLRTLIPPHLSLNAFTNAQSALAACRERVYRVILVDTEIPDVNSSVLGQQLRVLQPHATLVALALKTNNDVAKEAREQGFDDALLKPFRPETVDDFLLQHFDNQDLLSVEDNVLRVAPWTGRADRVERFYGRLNGLYADGLEKVAAACFDEVILELGAPPLDGERLPKFVLAVHAKSQEFGMTLVLVAAPEVKALFAGFEETTGLDVYASMAEARTALRA